MIYTEDFNTGLRELIRENVLTAEQAEAIADKLNEAFTPLARQRVSLTVTIEVDPEYGETDEDEVSSRAVDLVDSALIRELGSGSYAEVSLDSTEDAE